MRIHICMPFECKQTTIQVFRRGGLQALVAMILMTINSNLNPKTLDYPGNGYPGTLETGNIKAADQDIQDPHKSRARAGLEERCAQGVCTSSDALPRS